MIWSNIAAFLFLPFSLFLSYLIYSYLLKKIRIDIVIKPKEKKKRTKNWLRKRLLYRKVRRFLWKYECFRPSLVFYQLCSSEESLNYVFSRAKQLEQVGYCIRIKLMIESETNPQDYYFRQIYGKPEPIPLTL
jgi:hypothetical protein